uniref:Uncharacterized protein n=1 Tax=Mesocestoides corti TaxID=53468 RepID=A0A5K3FR53_MESCO
MSSLLMSFTSHHLMLRNCNSTHLVPCAVQSRSPQRSRSNCLLPSGRHLASVHVEVQRIWLGNVFNFRTAPNYRGTPLFARGILFDLPRDVRKIHTLTTFTKIGSCKTIETTKRIVLPQVQTPQGWKDPHGTLRRQRITRRSSPGVSPSTCIMLFERNFDTPRHPRKQSAPSEYITSNMLPLC